MTEDRRVLFYDSIPDDIPDDYKDIIFETLQRIPTEDLEKIQLNLDRIVWMGTGHAGATPKTSFTCLAKHDIRKEEWLGETIETVKPVYHHTWIMIVVEDNIKDFSKPALTGFFAHELAHVFLEHDRFGDQQDESMADERVKKWGLEEELSELKRIQKESREVV